MDIAQDIADEILIRLPMKSLIRFKGVCKSWYVNIHSDSFIAKHLKNQTRNQKILISQFNQQDSNINYNVSICSEQEKEEEDDDGCRTLFHQSDNQHYFIKQIPLEHMKGPTGCRGVEIIGTCNGLVCFNYRKMLRTNQNNVRERVITLWNPATRDFKTLPKFQPRRLPQTVRMSSDHVGFGLHIAKNDYKVIRILYFLKLEEYIIQVKIYSLNTNSWRKIDRSCLSTKIITSGLNNGTLFDEEKFCWLARDAMRNERLILWFDMGTEEFENTPFPSDYVDLGELHSVTGLFHLRDSIALVQCAEGGTEKTVAIWTTKELKQGRSSWIRMWNIGPLSGIGRQLGFWKCKNSNDYLFLFLNFGNRYKNPMKGIYMNNEGQIKNDSLMTIKVKNVVDIPLQVLTYIETLVSVNKDHKKSSLRFS